jgi:uncharacterized protein
MRSWSRSFVGFSRPELARPPFGTGGTAARRSGKLRALATAVPRLGLRLYRYALSPMVGPSCRFEPSCSRFAEEALDRYGLLRGTLMAFNRLLRCHPWGAGGFDPVP